jgi:uncharacterized membrane protein
MSRTSMGLEQNVAGLMCYVLGWVSGLIFILIEKDNRFVRFHAAQSLVLFGSISILFVLLPAVPFLGVLLAPFLGLLSLALWIAMMILAYQNQEKRLPVVADLADKLLSRL